MDYEFRVVVEKVAVASQKVIKRDIVKIYDIKQPKSGSVFKTLGDYIIRA